MRVHAIISSVAISLLPVCHAATIWADDFSTGRDAGTPDPNPYSYTGAAGNDYSVTVGGDGNAFVVSGGVLNISDTLTVSPTPVFIVPTTRFATTTFNPGDLITVSMDIRVNSLLGAGNSVPRLTISSAGAELLTVGYGHATFSGTTSLTMGFYKGGHSANSVGAANGIGINAPGFDFGVYDSGSAAANGTNDTWYRIQITLTQGQVAYTGSITNLSTLDVADFDGNLANSTALAWANDSNNGFRVYAGQGGTSNFDVDNLTVALVPEPSVILLGGLAALVWTGRRRL